MITGEMTLGVRDRLGRTHVWDFEGGVVRVFTADGAITKVLGGLGQGPGQFRVIDAVRVAEDGSIWVFDQVNSRATVYSSELELRETIRFETAPSYAVELLPDRQTLLSKTIRTRERIGYLLHVVDGNGNLARSIGNPDAIVHPGLPGSFTGRHLAPSNAGGFWTVHPTEYRIRRWHLDGTTDRDVTRVADWFLTGPERFDLSFEQGLPAGVLAIQEGGDGLLWVLVRVSDVDWRDSLRGRRTNGEPIFGGVREDIYDVVVEVIDPVLRTVVASARLPQWITGFVDEGVLGGIVHEGLDMYFQTWTVELEQTIE